MVVIEEEGRGTDSKSIWRGRKDARGRVDSRKRMEAEEANTCEGERGGAGGEGRGGGGGGRRGAVPSLAATWRGELPSLSIMFGEAPLIRNTCIAQRLSCSTAR